MLLVADIGNSKIRLGLYTGEQLLSTWQMATDRTRTALEWGQEIVQSLQQSGYTAADIEGMVLSCVTPGLLDPFVMMASDIFSCLPLVVTGETPTLLDMGYGTPKTLGPDRLVNCVAAVEAYGAPVIVVDLGTATTIDCVNDQGVFLGGAIAPGIGTALQALLLAAPGLPPVELNSPMYTIGTNTMECMQIGLVRYAAVAIDGLIHQMQAEMGCEATVVATGGLAEVMRTFSTEIQFYQDDLMLEGLRLVYAYNIF